jgi:hypothetical protein
VATLLWRTSNPLHGASDTSNYRANQNSPQAAITRTAFGRREPSNGLDGTPVGKG